MAEPTDLLRGDRRWIAWTGLETDLIFNEGWDLPGFAAFPLALDPAGRDRLARYYDAQVALAREAGTGAILDSATWMASADRGGPLGHDAEALARANAEAVALARAARDRAGGDGVLVSGQVGPRGDAYAAGMAGVEEAQAYHRVQVAQLAAAGADLITAYTLGSAAEAAGIAQAAAAEGVPCVISFTVETDGRLADGTPVGGAVAAVDGHTGGTVLGYCINCAHPDHFRGALSGDWTDRLIGLVPNASRRSHAELDAATDLDAGDPEALAADLGALRRALPRLTVFGGCCGTDLRHLRATAAAVA